MSASDFRCVLVSDIHGNSIALDAVFEDAASLGFDEVWALGDLVALGPDPVGVLERLTAHAHLRCLRGNTDRYTVTSDRPPPTLGDALARPEHFAIVLAMEARFSWTAGMVTAAGWRDWLRELPETFRVTFPDGSTALAVHSEPTADDGPGLGPHRAAHELEAISAEAATEMVLAGHTHVPFDRTVGGTRLVNLGSVSNPQPPDLRASYVVLTATSSETTVDHRRVDYDRDAVMNALDEVGHPESEYLKMHFRGEVVHGAARSASQRSGGDPLKRRM